MKVDLTPEQEKEVSALVALGWARDAAVLMVVETAEDVVDLEPDKP